MTRNEIVGNILRNTTFNMLADCDVRQATDAIVCGMERLLAECDVEELPAGEADEYTRELVDAYIGFVAAWSAEIGGSDADYCADNATLATVGYRLRLRETAGADEILHEMRVGFHRSALNPGRMFGRMSRAGIPIGRKGCAA